MRTTILTANYNGYDSLKPILPQSIDVEWICVHDNPAAPCEENGWQLVYEPRDHLHPNRAAKTPKCLPWLYTSTTSSIWLDASYRVTSPTFAENILRYAEPIAQFFHPWRQCAYAEMDESLKLIKYAGQPIEWHRKRYEAMQFPKGEGLWATGVIARYHTTEVIQFGHDWLAEIHQGSFQDQISQPPMLWKNNLRPIPLPGTHLSNEWLSYEGSGRH